MNRNIDAERDALQRQLEHHIEELCFDISKDIIIINDSVNVTQDNFACMTHVGESLETLHSAVITIMEYILTVKTAEKMISKLPFIDIKNE